MEVAVLYEYRRYEVVPGRRGDLNRRFATHTLKIWEKHQIEVVGFWEAVVGVTNELHYILRWKNMAERDEKWSAFATDPEWLAAVTETERDGPLAARIHNSFWAPTDYSPMR
jgi:hypothetical protein